MKNFIKWIKSPSGDFALFIVLLILANIAGQKAFVRFDMTAQKSYSLSKASKDVVKNLTEPLSVNVFFSGNLPAPYNGTAQYVQDILVEYKGSANKNFSYKFFDMNKAENQRIADGYGLRQAQIQEIKNNEVGFKQAYMGLAISYGDSIEIMDSITSSDGFEYKLTSKISKMISTTDILAGLDNGALTMTLYETEDLKNFRIGGLSEAESIVREAFDSVNKKNMNRMTFVKKTPSGEEARADGAKYGLQTFNWKNKDGSEGVGIFGLVLEYADSFRVIPLTIQSSIFGYVVSGTDDIESNITTTMQGLLSKSTQIGYVTGHGEAELKGENGASLHLASIVSDMYEFKTLNLAEDTVPPNITSMVINGAKTAFTDEELYKIDQFVMKGGNLLIFADPLEMQQGNYYQPPVFTPVTTGMSRLLDRYGIKPGSDYVFDENCYTSRQQGYGNVKLYWAPLMQKKQLAKHPVTSNLGYVIFLQAGSIDISAAESDKNLKASVLVKSSEHSWTQADNIDLSPNLEPPYDKSTEKSENLAVLVEGRFKSAFDKDITAKDGGKGELESHTHLSESAQPGKIFFASTAYIASNQLIDEEGTEPVALFVRNAIDYMNGNEDLCTMRTKGLSLNVLANTAGIFAPIIKYFNQFGLAVLTALAGLIVWKFRIMRKARIRETYNPDDERDISKSK